MDPHELRASHDPVLEHVAWMRQLAYELVRDPGTAEDLVQETWLAFLRARPDTERPLRPWLSRVVRNAAALRVRRGAGRVAREAEVAASELLPSAHQLVERAEEQQRLSEAVLALDEPYLSVILLRYYEGLTPKQIAQAQGVPAATVRSQLHRGLAKLRERLDREHGGDRRAWVMMLQPLWMEFDVPAAGLSSAAWVGISLAATALLWFGVTWTLRDAREPALEPAHVAAPPAPVDTRAPAPDRSERVAMSNRAATAAAAERAWRLVDARTNAPLRDYVVLVDGEERRSDDEGRVLLPARTTSIELIDDSRLAQEVLRGHTQRVERAMDRVSIALPVEPEAADLRLDAGPTFRLEIAGEGAVLLNELTARLVVDETSGEQATPRPIQLAPVRAPDAVGGTPWVRFAGTPRAWDDPARAWRIEVRDREGFRIGSAPVETTLRETPSVVRVELRSTGVVMGHVGGLPPEQLSRVTVTLTPDDDDRQWVELEQDGDYVLRWVPPGTHSLRIIAPAQDPLTAEVTVLAGARTTQDYLFEVRMPAGPIAGSVHSQSGNYRGQLLVFLLDEQGFVLDIFPTTWVRGEDGTLTANFRFDPAPPGRLGLDVLSLQDAVTFEFGESSLAAPRENLRITLLDAEPAADHAFLVIDAQSGATLTDFEVEVRIGSGVTRCYHAEPPADESSAQTPNARLWTTLAGELRWNRFESTAPLRRLPNGTRFTWIVRSPGYTDARGTEADFVIDPSGSGRSVNVALERE